MVHVTALYIAMVMKTEHNILDGENPFFLNIYTSLNECFVHFYLPHDL